MSFWHREEFSKFSSTLLWAGWTQISSSRWDSDNCELSGHMLTELEEPNKYEHPSDKWALRNMDARAYFCQHGKISPTKNAGYDNFVFFPVKYQWQVVHWVFGSFHARQLGKNFAPASARQLGINLAPTSGEKYRTRRTGRIRRTGRPGRTGQNRLCTHE